MMTVQIKEMDRILKARGWIFVGQHEDQDLKIVRMYQNPENDTEIHIDSDAGYSIVSIPDMPLEDFLDIIIIE